VQAGAYLATIRISPREYLQLYKTQRIRLLRNRPPISAWNYQYTVFSTWEISYAALERKHPDSARLLELCSFLNPHAIPYALLAAASRTDGDRANIWNRLYESPVKSGMLRALYRATRNRRGNEEVNEGRRLTPDPLMHHLMEAEFGLEDALQAIFELSLASENGTKDALVIHPLVRTWCQNRDSQQPRAAEQALICVARSLDQSRSNEPLWRDSTLHLPSCLSILSNYIDPSANGRKIDINTLHAIDVIGRTLETTESTGQEATFLLLHRSLVQAKGPGHVLTLATYGRLATAIEVHSLTDAEKYHAKSVADAMRYLGRTHPDTITYMQNLGANITQQRRWHDGEAILAPIYHYRHAQDPLALGTLQTAVNLAVCIAGSGRPDDAISLLQDVLNRIESPATHGDADFQHLKCQTFGNLALVYTIGNQMVKAEETLVAAAAYAERTFGSAHHYTINSLLSLDGFYRGAGPELMDVPLPPLQLEKSMATQARLLKIWDHLDLELKSRFAQKCVDLSYAIGDLDGVEAMLDRFEEALIRGGSDVDEEFMQVSEAEIALSRGLAHWERGLLPSAIANSTCAMQKYEAMAPKRTKDLAIASVNLAVAYRDAGELDQARTCLLRARRLESQLSGGRLEDLLWIDTHLAMVHLAGWELEKAQELMEKTQTLMNEHLLPYDRFNLLNQYAMACLHEARGDVEEAIRIAKSTLDAKVQGMGLEQTATLKTALMLARLYRSTGNSNEADRVADLIRPYSQYW
jgi:tetratricopeptide (TPR) repeat protein